MSPKSNSNMKKITAPLAAFTMASILFVYARTSIQAAKRNAQKHREADGGQISWRNESLRQHGVLEREEVGLVETLTEKAKGGKRVAEVKGMNSPVGETEAERKVRERARVGK